MGLGLYGLPAILPEWAIAIYPVVLVAVLGGYGFLLAHWDGTRETEDRIQKETQATIRCLPFDRPQEAGVCMVTGQPSARRAVFAKAY